PPLILHSFPTRRSSDLAAFLEVDFRMGGLEEIDADLAARDMCGNCQYRNAAPLAVEQTVDQVKIARTAAAGTDRQLAGQMRLGADRKSTRLNSSHVAIS